MDDKEIDLIEIKDDEKVYLKEKRAILSNKTKKVLKYIGFFESIIVNLIIIFCTIFSAIQNLTIYKDKGYSTFMGYCYSTVGSSSMEPTINKNDYILIDRSYDYNKFSVNYDDIYQNEIVVFYGVDSYGNKIPVVHRIISKGYYEENSFATKGDNNPYSDTMFCLTKDNYIGRYVKTLNGFEVAMWKSYPFILAGIFLLNLYIYKICDVKFKKIRIKVVIKDEKE